MVGSIKMLRTRQCTDKPVYAVWDIKINFRDNYQHCTRVHHAWVYAGIRLVSCIAKAILYSKLTFVPEAVLFAGLFW